MSLSEEILKRTRLPKPTSQTTFVAIIPSDDDSKSSSSSRSSTKSQRTRPCKTMTKNANLYDQDECAPEPSYSVIANEYEINKSIRETNGGSVSSVDIESKWKLRVEENRLKEIKKQKELDRIRAVEEIENERHQKAEEAKKKRLKKKQEEKENATLEGPNETKEFVEVVKNNKKLFRNNALMRGLVEQKLANLKLTTENGKDTDSDDNNENSGNTANGPVLFQSVEDPDFFFLRDTTSRDFDKTDNYRFVFRGSKQVVTPRQYALYEIADKDFEFKTKSS